MVYLSDRVICVSADEPVFSATISQTVAIFGSIRVRYSSNTGFSVIYGREMEIVVSGVIMVVYGRDYYFGRLSGCFSR